MNFRHFTAFIVFGISGLANADEIEEANKEVFLCQYKAAARFDDGTSDVGSIVPAVVIACQRETRAFAEAIRRTINGPVDEPRVRAAVEGRNIQFATQMVLMQRADARKR